MTEEDPRSEYPRPQFQRKRWDCLNGPWEFAFDDSAATSSAAGDPAVAAPDWSEKLSHTGRIIVPFPYQSELSGIGDRAVHPVVWYRRHFKVAASWKNHRVLLHFGAVDFQSDYWLNGRHIGSHEGGYTPVFFDLSDALATGDNVLTVRCVDLPSDEQPCGKQDRQTHQPYRFAATTGIWQTVWLEPVAEDYLESCRIVPDFAAGRFRLTPHVTGNQQGLRLIARATFAGREVGELATQAGAHDEPLQLSELYPWSPDHPHLYDIELSLYRGDDLLDTVKAYAGLRDLAIDGRRILLNGEPIYQRQVLDQGYWPDGIYTGPTDSAIQKDVEWTRRLGFNGARKHQKIEDPRWLYWCDRLGLLVWEEMPAFNADTPLSRERLRREWREVIVRDLNHPSVVAWVPFNESFGIRGIDTNTSAQDFVAAVVSDTRALDPTRPVVDNSGWSHVDTDIADSHNYDPAGAVFLDSWRRFHEGDGPERGNVMRSWDGYYGGREWYGAIYPRRLFVPGRDYSGQPILISEWGGFFLAGAGEVAPILHKRRGVEPDEEAFLARYSDMIAAFDSLPDLMGDCWTQLTDIEDEPNGLLTEDRRPKVDVERIHAINHGRFES